MQEEISSAPRFVSRFGAAIAVPLVVVVAVAAYAFHEHNVSKQLAAQNSAMTSSLNATRDQVNALTAKLDAMNAQRVAEQAPAAPVYHKPMKAAAARHRVEDPRWKK